MPLFSEEISKKSSEVQRHLYSAFRDAVRSGDIEALKLLTKFKLAKVRDGFKEVFDYAYTSDTQLIVHEWIKENEHLPTKGVTAEQIKNISDDQLVALIKKQQTPTKKRAKRNTKSKPKSSS